MPQKGYQRKNHKYSARQWVNGRWKYFYGQAKNAVGYAYGSKYREDMDKYHDVEDRAQANMWKANEDNWKLKNKIEDNAKNGGPNAVLNGKALRKEKERNQEYFDKQYAKAQDANDKYGHAGTKYYKSLAYKVEKATGAYDKGRAERARKKGYDGLAEKHEEAYENSIGAKANSALERMKNRVQKHYKKKNIKHSDLDYQETVVNGEILIDQLLSNEELEHSYKGQAWKNHKYIKKKMVNGKWRYYYGPNDIDYTDDRKSAEYKAREMDYNYTGDGEDYKHFQDREIQDRKATEGTDQDMYSNHKELDKYFGVRDNKLKSEVNERYGANGMPSDVATKQRENANEQFDRYFRERKHGKGKKGHF